MDAVPKVIGAERQPLHACRIVVAHACDQEAERPRHQAAYERPAAHHPHHRYRYQPQHEELRCGERIHHRTRYRDRYKQEDGPDDAADQRRKIRRRQCDTRFALPRKRIAVQYRRLPRRGAGHAQQHCGQRIARRDCRDHAYRQRQRNERVEPVREAQQHHEARHCAAGHRAIQHANRNAYQQRCYHLPTGDMAERFSRRFKHLLPLLPAPARCYAFTLMHASS